VNHYRDRLYPVYRIVVALRTPMISWNYLSTVNLVCDESSPANAIREMGEIVREVCYTAIVMQHLVNTLGSTESVNYD